MCLEILPAFGQGKGFMVAARQRPMATVTVTAS